MKHNPNIVQLGTTRSNIKEVTNYVGKVAAGLAVRRTSTGGLSVAKADGELQGVSLGQDLSDTNRTAVVRKGLEVPLQLTDGFNPTPGTVVHISDTTGRAAASGAGATATSAVYNSGRLTGGARVEAGDTSLGVALVDFVGGL